MPHKSDIDTSTDDASTNDGCSWRWRRSPWRTSWRRWSSPWRTSSQWWSGTDATSRAGSRPGTILPYHAKCNYISFPSKEPLTASMLAAAPQQDQKQMLGERMFPLVQAGIPLSLFWQDVSHFPLLFLAKNIQFFRQYILTWLAKLLGCCWTLTMPRSFTCWSITILWGNRYKDCLQLIFRLTSFQFLRWRRLWLCSEPTRQLPRGRRRWRNKENRQRRPKKIETKKTNKKEEGATFATMDDLFGNFPRGQGWCNFQSKKLSCRFFSLLDFQSKKLFCRFFSLLNFQSKKLFCRFFFSSKFSIKEIIFFLF